MPGATCLTPQALAAQLLLARAGYPSSLRMGARRRDGVLEAHAWLEDGERVVYGARGEFIALPPIEPLLRRATARRPLLSEVPNRLAAPRAAPAGERTAVSGIAALFRTDGTQVERSLVAAMLATMPYRGPHGQGIWTGDGIGLGHLALQATPQSLHERQPLVQGDVALVADCRLDNRAELLAALAVPPHDACPTRI